MPLRNPTTDLTMQLRTWHERQSCKLAKTSTNFVLAALAGLVLSKPALVAAQNVSIPGKPPLEIVASTSAHSSNPVFSRDGRYLVFAGGNGAALWDFAHKRLVRVFSGLRSINSAAAISPDGRLIAAASGATLNVWEVETGRVLSSFAPQVEVGSIAFLADGSRLVYGGQSFGSYGKTKPSLYVRDVPSGAVIKTLSGNGWIAAVAVAPDGKTIAAGDAAGQVHLLDSGGRTIRSFKAHGSSLVHALAFSPDGRFLASGGADKTARIWDLTNGRLQQSFAGHSGNDLGYVYSVAWSPEGRFLATTDLKTLRLWETKTGLLHRSAKAGDADHPASFISAIFTPDGRRILAAGANATLFDADTLKHVEKWTGANPISKIVSDLSTTSNTVVLNGVTPLTIVELDVGRGALKSVFSDSDPTRFWHDVSASADRQTFATVLSNSSLAVVRPIAGKGISTIRADLKEAWFADLSFDGKLAAFKNDNHVEIVDVETGRILQRLRGSSFGPSNHIKFTADGKTLITGWTGDPTIRLFDVLSGKQRGALNPRIFSKFVSSRKGDKFLVIGTDLEHHALEYWSVGGPKAMRKLSLPGEASHLSSGDFHPNDRHAVIGGFDGLLRVWDLEAGALLRTLRGHNSPISDVKYTVNGERIVSSASDGVKVWDAQTGALLTSHLIESEDNWLTITPEGFFDASSPKAAQNLSIVRGLEVSSVDQVYDALYRPDLVREKLAGDLDGKVRAAAAKLDLAKVMASGFSPKVAIGSPTSGSSVATDEVEVEASIADRGGGIGKVEWRINGVTLGVETRGLQRIDGSGAPGGRTEKVKRTLALEPGDNRIEVVAYNAKNLIASEAAHVIVKWDGERTATPPKLHVLAVAVNDYWDSRLKLSYAVPDATALADAFRKTGSGLYASVEVTTVLDADVTVANLDRVFSEVGQKVKARDVFVFFLAGHGKTRQGRYYFLPRDFRYEDETSLEKTGMDQDRFQAWFSKIPARKSILLYDTCESGSLTGAKARGGSELDERLGALNRMARATGRTFLTATTDDAPALEGYRGHGVFTYALLDAFSQADVNGNGLIEISELADHIDRKVPDLSFEAFKLRQIPQRSIVGNNFALSTKATVLAAAPVPQSAHGALATKPTHVVISANPIDVYEEAFLAGRTVQKLTGGTLITVIKTENGWSLIAKDGRQIGYVAGGNLLPVQ